MTTKAKHKKAMTLEQFFKALPKRGWYMNQQRCVRRYSGGVRVCPVCAVANRIAKRHKYNISHISAACEMGMKKELARRLANAADGDSSRLRSRLLKHCGLKESEAYHAPGCFLTTKTKEGQA